MSMLSLCVYYNLYGLQLSTNRIAHLVGIFVYFFFSAERPLDVAQVEGVEIVTCDVTGRNCHDRRQRA